LASERHFVAFVICLDTFLTVFAEHEVKKTEGLFENWVTKGVNAPDRRKILVVRHGEDEESSEFKL